ncbi:MAG: hypothetical protein FJ151_04480 [Euryarchaeota archaeon]|nr:hypothetical protein [Euryarchaeota archaeon]
MGGCGIAGCISVDGNIVSGETITRMLTTMSERENGLGAGYACYGLFPERRDEFCLQLLFDSEEAKEEAGEFLMDHGEVTKDERVFTKDVPTLKPPYPLVWRFFLRPGEKREWRGNQRLTEEDFVVKLVMHINKSIDGAFCVSSGKDMAVFKGNGYSYEVSEFYDLDRYSGKMWLSHSRFPTNSPGWWGGAHPISILDWAVCHNGEITSYGVNKKLVEMAGYNCTLLTDTEVVAYMWDLLVRRHGLPIQTAAFAMAPWYYSDIPRLDPESRRLATLIRATYKEAFLNGPFSILVGRREPEITMIALADRKKLRPLIVGESPDQGTVLSASEECAIRAVEPDAETWTPNAGSPVIAQVGKGVVRAGVEPPFWGLVE